MAVASPDYDPTLPPEPYAMYQVKVSSDPADVANVSGTGRYKTGTQVWINASSRDADYHFAYWLKDGVQYTTSQSFYYTVGTAAVNFVAHFEYVEPVVPEYNPTLPEEPQYKEPVVVIPSYPLHLVCDPSDGGSFNRTSGTNVERGSSVTCCVYPNQDFAFLGWYNAEGEKLSSSTSFTYTMPDAGTTLTAKLEYMPGLPADPSTTPEQPEIDNDDTQYFTLTGATAGHGSVAASATEAVKVGTRVTLTATADAHYHFAYWSDGTKQNPYDVTVSRDETITAYFEMDQCVLTDGAVYDQTEAIEWESVVYTRNFKNLNWQPLYVPMAIPVDLLAEQGLEVAELNNVHMYDNDDDGEYDEVTMEFLRMKRGSTMANCPYIIRANEEGQKTLTFENLELQAAESNSIDCMSAKQTFTFTGTYTGMDGQTMFDNNYYGMGGGRLSRVSGPTVGLKPQRWYMSITNRDGSAVDYYAQTIRVMIYGEETGIETTNLDPNPNLDVVDLMGRRVKEGRTSGLYVVNGKVVMFKK